MSARLNPELSMKILRVLDEYQDDAELNIHELAKEAGIVPSTVRSKVIAAKLAYYSFKVLGSKQSYFYKVSDLRTIV